MKKTLLLILAMCFAFAMPAQATEGYEGFAPAYLVADAGDSIGVKVTDNKVISQRCMWSQLEAADFYLSNHTTYETASATPSIAFEPTGQGAMHEVGWRVSTT